MPHKMKELAINFDSLKDYYNTMLWIFILFVSVYINRTVYQLIVNLYLRNLMAHVRNLSYSRWLKSFDQITDDKNICAGTNFLKAK